MATTTAEALAEARALEAPLSAKLAHYATQLRHLAPAAAGTYDRMVAQLTAGEIGTFAPGVGQEMPSFVLPADDGRLVSSDEIFARGSTVLSFNRGHWCPFCKLEIAALTAAAPEITTRGGQIISITPETAAYSKKLRADAKAPFTFLSDIGSEFALQLGLAMWVGDELRRLFVSGGLDLAKFHANDHWLLPVPATFVVARSGSIVDRHIDPDFRRRATIEDILAWLP